MGGDKKKQAHSRQVKAAERARERKNMERKSHPSVYKPNPMKVVQIPQDVFSDAQMSFWVCHGINYILSDYDNGVWSPMFEGIYDDISMSGLMQPGDITQTILDKYNVSGTSGIDDWPVEAKSALAWAVSDRSVVYVYYREAIRRLAAAHGGTDSDIDMMAKGPHQPLVWALFNFLKQQTMRHKDKRNP